MNAWLPGAGLALSIVLAGCSGAEAARLDQARIDTLAGGIVRVTSAGPTAWRDAAGANLIEEARFSGEDGTPSELGEPRSIAVDEAGRIYVVDSKPAAIKVFTPEGELIRSFGREGEGPGEFRVGFIAIRGPHVVLHDPRVARTSVFDTAGRFIRSWHTSCCYWGDIQVDQEGRIYVPSTAPGKPDDPPRGTPYVRWSLEGAELDTLWVPRRKVDKYWTVQFKGNDGKMRGMMSTTVPFMPLLVHALHPDGGFVYGWTGDYRIVRSLTGSDTVRLAERAWTPEPLTEAERKAEIENKLKQAAGESFGRENLAAYREAFKLEDVPSTLPAYLNLRVDAGGRVWVRRFTPSDTLGVLYDLFDGNGALLGPVRVPVKVPEWGPQVWTRNGLVTVIEDADGRPTVVRFTLGAKP